jgi:hypothetical protein
MSTAYRDDLDAARARVGDLEREAERLRTRNAELTAKNREKVEPSEKPEPIAAPEPEPSAFAKTMSFLTILSLASAAFALGFRKYHHDPPPAVHPGWAAIFLALAFVFWCFSGFRNPWRQWDRR